jgi:NAD(P)-dependent dehydrogenase (short-subunit alcohol dehydrogenase family)
MGGKSWQTIVKRIRVAVSKVEVNRLQAVKVMDKKPAGDQVNKAGNRVAKAVRRLLSFALRNELKDSGVTVTCLMPGATETEFFERADMLDTKVGQSKKDDPVDVAKVGFDAMMNGEGDVVAGWKNKLQSAAALITPSDVLAEQHRKMAEPGSANK